MANSYTLLANLKVGRCSNTTEVCLLRFWHLWFYEAPNVKKRGQLMTVEMLFLDEKSLSLQKKSHHQIFPIVALMVLPKKSESVRVFFHWDDVSVTESG
ncbi:hypothetical protein IGI04_014655 [Brassica rapa subsp. trilocularis]|uniref:Uncharacterized protein n=1 Tax=Brassica rapa subsp. trilocularis TaxID=1813537 RepID=A0ABQ7MPB5_BRACM|nr:hypothetical protein IGI04_014655 [Brassica rapa subsp. trilocularis]